MMVLFYAYSLVSAKLISASGVMYVYYGARFRALTLATVGSAAVRPEALTAGTYVDGIFMNNMCQMEAPMSHMLGAFKVLRTSRTSAKLFTVAAAAGVVVMLAAVLPTLLLVTHRVGANAMDEWFFGGHPLGAFAQLDSVLRTPAIPDNRLRLALPLGAAIMLGLVYMHSNFLWWAISPIGFVIASSEMTNRTVWGNFLIGWLVSLVIRRTGGLRLYRAAGQTRVHRTGARRHPERAGSDVAQCDAWRSGASARGRVGSTAPESSSVPERRFRTTWNASPLPLGGFIEVRCARAKNECVYAPVLA